MYQILTRDYIKDAIDALENAIRSSRGEPNEHEFAAVAFKAAAYLEQLEGMATINGVK